MDCFAEGNMDVRMAEAVEEASAVLVCFSKKYQESDNCRKGRFFVSKLHKLFEFKQFCH